jgi:hypothetical protein
MSISALLVTKHFDVGWMPYKLIPVFGEEISSAQISVVGRTFF